MTVKKKPRTFALHTFFAILASFITSEVWAQAAPAPLLRCPGFFQAAKVKCQPIGFFYDQHSDACVFLYKTPRNIDSQLGGLCPSPCTARVTSPDTLNIGRGGDSYLVPFNTCGEVRHAGRCPADNKIPVHEADYAVSCQKLFLSNNDLVPFPDDE